MSSSWGQIVDDDMRQYLKEIAVSLQSREQPDDLELQVRAALDETKGQEVKIATDVECSHCFEQIIKVASEEQVLSIFTALAQQDALYKVATKCAPVAVHL
jgi:hypothetical protein